MRCAEDADGPRQGRHSPRRRPMRSCARSATHLPSRHHRSAASTVSQGCSSPAFCWCLTMWGAGIWFSNRNAIPAASVVSAVPNAPVARAAPPAPTASVPSTFAPASASASAASATADTTADKPIAAQRTSPHLRTVAPIAPNAPDIGSELAASQRFSGAASVAEGRAVEHGAFDLGSDKQGHDYSR